MDGIEEWRGGAREREALMRWRAASIRRRAGAVGVYSSIGSMWRTTQQHQQRSAV